MFERFTEAARRTLFFARYEVSVLGESAIDTEHLLLGVARVNGGVVGKIFETAGLSYEQIRQRFEPRIASARTPPSVEVPFTEAARRVLKSAADEAEQLGHSYVGIEHLLLGLLREEGSVAASILTDRGLRLDDIRTRVVELLNEAAAESSAVSGNALVHVEAIERLVQELARIVSGSNEGRRLIDPLQAHLRALRQQLSE